MSKCNFNFESQDAVSLLQRAKTAISSKGGMMEGDNESGNFEISTPIGTVKGMYAIDSGSINLIITQKPMLVSCSKIEEKLREQMV